MHCTLSRFVVKRIDPSVTPINHFMKLLTYHLCSLSFSFLQINLCGRKKDSSSPLAQAVEEVYPAIVRIEVVSEQGSSGRDDEISGNREWSYCIRRWSGCDQPSCCR